MKEVLILSDFDGTITVKDVGVEIVSNFGREDWNQIKEEYIEGKLSSKDLQSIYYENLTENQEHLLQYIDNNILLDRYF